jgi:hypothetical protein
MEYIQRLQEAIRHMHNCESLHVETVPVKEWFKEQLVWDGEVEVFDLNGHPEATRCYSWAYEDDYGHEQFTAVLGLGPVVDAKAAVRAALIAKVKNAPKKT